MNVALYLRMSSDKQETSIPQQEKALRELCSRKGYRIVATYRDEGISGDATEKRRGFLKMLADAPGGNFRRIVAYDQDRFGRFDMLEAGYYISPLRKAKVTLETIAQGLVDWENFGGRVIYGVLQEGKHQYLRDISLNILRGLTAKAEECQGYPGGPAPYGYRRVTQLQGNRRLSHLVTDEAEAAIVARIFREYLAAHASCNIVANRLNRDKVPSPGKADFWKQLAVQRILSNPAYIGMVAWGKRSSGKYSMRSREGVIARKADTDVEPAGPIMHRRPDLVPPIVDDETFQAAQRLLKERKHATRRFGTIRPLSGLIRCMNCGKGMYGDGGCYRCSTGSRGADGKQCSGRRVPQKPLIEMIVAKLREELGSPKALPVLRNRIAKYVADIFQKPKADPSIPIRKRIAELEKTLADGAARLLVVPPGLVPELSKALDVVRRDRDAMLEGLATAQSAGEAIEAPAPAKIVSELMQQFHRLDEVIAGADAARINEAFQRMGVRVNVHARQGESKNFTAAIELQPSGVLFRSLNKAKRDSTAPPVLSFNVAVDAAKPKLFAKGNRLQQIGNRNRLAGRQAETRQRRRRTPAVAKRRAKA
jgi:DNA invertase Pin-like site-specific DNA recombinase